VVRHGETEWNAEGRIQGHRQVGLNGRGARQADAVADRLASWKPQALYSSDLLRSAQTASAIARATGLAVVEDPALREWDLGVLAGLRRHEAERRYPEAYRVYSTLAPDPTVPGGESIRMRYRRTTSAAEAISGRHPGEKVVVVTHGGPLDDFYRRSRGMPLEAPRDFELFNGGVNTFRVSGGTWSLLRWGDISHLEGIGAMGHWEGCDGRG